MNDSVARAHRLIEIQAHLRGSGTAPDPRSIERLLAFVISSDLAGDHVVRQFLLATAEELGDDYFVASKLLDAVLPLVASGHPQEGLAIFRRVLRYDSPEVWYGRGRFGSFNLFRTAFTKVLGHDRLLLEHPDSWGALAVSMLSRLLLAYQRDKWPERQTLRNALADALGEGRPQPAEFTPVYDDVRLATVWNFDTGRGRSEPHSQVAAAIEAVLKQAASLAVGQAFSRLADELIAFRWSLTIAVPLRVLGDRIRADAGTTWHAGEGVRLLSNPIVLSLVSIGIWRRLLRTSLDGRINAAEQEQIVHAIRSHVPRACRLRELADVTGWDAVTADERLEVQKAIDEGEVPPLRDPRDPVPDLSTAAESSELLCYSIEERWPVPQQRPRITLLRAAAGEGNAPMTEEDLSERLNAIAELLQAPQASDATWRYNFLHWGELLLTEVKRAALLRRGKDPKKEWLSAAEFVEEARALAPRWEVMAEWALQGVASEPPENHRQHSTAVPAWSPEDPIFASLTFLDELLAVSPGAPLDAIRQRLGEAVAAAWVCWPAYTKSVSLVLLRPFHWRRTPQLPQLAESALGTETDATVLLQTVDMLLGTPGIADQLHALLSRLPHLAAGDLTTRIGALLSDATLRSRGEADPLPVFHRIAGLFDATLANVASLNVYGLAWLHGVVWGAAERLRMRKQRTERLATAWQAIAGPALDTALSLAPNGERIEGLLQGVMLGLELGWPDSIRAGLYDSIGPSLECVIRGGTLGDVAWLHYLLGRELDGDLEGNAAQPGETASQPMRVVPRDELLVGFCRASVERVREWAAQKQTTDDLGWVSMLSGRDTAELIRKVFQAGHQDRQYIPRALPPIIDTSPRTRNRAR